jgi:hypothetical protein
MKTLKDYLEETIRRYGATGSSPGMGYTLEQGVSEGEYTIANDPTSHIKVLFLKTINGIEYRLVKQGDTYKIYLNRSLKTKQVFPSFELAKKALQQLLLNAVTSEKQGVTEDDVDEGWKQKVAGAALAGAAALGAGGAQAQSTDKYDSSWGTSGYDNHIRSDKSLTRTIGSDPSKDTNDFQSRIQSVTGPNAKGEYKVIVIQGNDIVSHYITKTPPPGWLYKEDAASNDPLLAKAVDLAPVSALEESAELRLILQRAKLIE